MRRHALPRARLPDGLRTDRTPVAVVVKDVGMVFFFALAAKEVFEVTCLSSPRRALWPLSAAIGSMAAGALIYVALVSALPGELTRGWRFRVRLTSRWRPWSRAPSFRSPPTFSRGFHGSSG